MTGQEKKMNKAILQEYKNYGRGFDNLIPGIFNYPTVGTRPTCRYNRSNNVSPIQESSPTNRGAVSPYIKGPQLIAREHISRQNTRSVDLGAQFQKDQSINPFIPLFLIV
jgi:hypothetical protein